MRMVWTGFAGRFSTPVISISSFTMTSTIAREQGMHHLLGFWYYRVALCSLLGVNSCLRVVCLDLKVQLPSFIFEGYSVYRFKFRGIGRLQWSLLYGGIVRKTLCFGIALGLLYCLTKEFWAIALHNFYIDTNNTTAHNDLESSRRDAASQLDWRKSSREIFSKLYGLLAILTWSVLHGSQRIEDESIPISKRIQSPKAGGSALIRRCSFELLSRQISQGLSTEECGQDADWMEHIQSAHFISDGFNIIDIRYASMTNTVRGSGDNHAEGRSPSSSSSISGVENCEPHWRCNWR